MAVSALQRLCYHWINPLLTLPVRKMTTLCRRPIANGLAASNQLTPAVVSACPYVTQDGAVEPENIVRDLTTSFSRSHVAPFTSSSVRT
jgi:hypothetical protein